MGQAQNNWTRKTVLFLVSQCITLFGSMIVQMSVIWHVTLKTSMNEWILCITKRIKQIPIVQTHNLRVSLPVIIYY